MYTVLVVAAHPDDEILGVGGTIARKVAEGQKAYALILGEGQTSRWDNRNLAESSVIEKLHVNTLEAAKIIGYSQVFFENFPDNRFDSVDSLDIVKKVEKYIRLLQPDAIYVHHAGDLRIDHRIANKAVLTAARPVGSCGVKEIYAFETVSSTEWNFGNRQLCFYPNVYVDIEKYFDLKCKAMKSYESELCEFPHPRSLEMLEILAKKWGSTVGKQYVEGFEMVRMIV